MDIYKDSERKTSKINKEKRRKISEKRKEALEQRKALQEFQKREEEPKKVIKKRVPRKVQKPKEEKPEKITRPVKRRHSSGRKKSSTGVFVLACIVTIICFLGLTGVCTGLFVANLMCEDIPDLKRADLGSTNSSVIYDSEGKVIAELGSYIRENVSYNELPNTLIDAFVAVEDSRFFEHFGFDVPRFAAAMIDVVRTKSFSQGGSTITMQLIKNSYFQTDEAGTTASRSGVSGVKRKVQEIVLAVQADREVGKKEILALYLNKVNFGSNIRGVEKAAQYYFGKTTSELNLSECAFLAGVINAPNRNNPYNNLERFKGNKWISDDLDYLANATERRNEVLDLMVYHGYITEAEAVIAKNIKLEDLLLSNSDRFETTTGYFQSYIDAVIEEVQELTGYDPYTYAMKIYTCMDSHMQETVYNIQEGNTGLEFSNDEMQSAIVVLNNQTGELIALSGARNQDGARSFNRAVDAYIQPGSTIKPVFEYALAIEKLGWSTAHTITDQPVFFYDTDLLVTNSGTQGYTGDMLMTEAVARSLNTPAVQTLEAVLEIFDDDQCVEYLKALGFDINNFDVQYAIGGSDLEVTPVQLCAAHAILMNGGYYIEPHTVLRIEFYDDTETIELTYKKEQVISEQTAFIVASLEEYNVTGGWYNYMQNLKSDYPVYAKTGTTDWGTTKEEYNIPVGAAKDGWQVAQTSNYSLVVWNGFDKAGYETYLTDADIRYNLKGKMARQLLDELETYFDYNPKAIEMPEGVTEIEIVKGAFPYIQYSEDYAELGYQKAKGYIKSDSLYAELLTLEQFEEQKETIVGSIKHVTVNTNSETNALNLIIHGFGYFNNGRKDTSIVSVSGMTEVWSTGRYYFRNVNYVNPDHYYVMISGEGINTITIESDSPIINGTYEYDFSTGEYILKDIYLTDYEGNIVVPEKVTVTAWTSDEEQEAFVQEEVEVNAPIIISYEEEEEEESEEVTE